MKQYAEKALPRNLHLLLNRTLPSPEDDAKDGDDGGSVIAPPAENTDAVSDDSPSVHKEDEVDKAVPQGNPVEEKLALLEDRFASMQGKLEDKLAAGSLLLVCTS